MSFPSPLPNFLGIGAPRAGTTWLHDLLDVHPDVLMPSRRKELNFFHHHYELGPKWYAESFRVPRGAPVPPRVGEISPHYMYWEQCLPRITALGTIDSFIVCLRNPADLTWSYYRYGSTIHNFRGSLWEFLEAFPEVRTYGLYARALLPWINQFGRDRFLFVRFDDLVSDPLAARTDIASFLGVDAANFPAHAGVEQTNKSITPRFPRLYSLAKLSVTRLHRADKSWIVKLVKKSGLKRVLGSESPNTSAELPDDTRRALFELYAADMLEFERLTGFDTRKWVLQDSPRTPELRHTPQNSVDP